MRVVQNPVFLLRTMELPPCLSGKSFSRLMRASLMRASLPSSASTPHPPSGIHVWIPIHSRSSRCWSRPPQSCRRQYDAGLCPWAASDAAILDSGIPQQFQPMPLVRPSAAQGYHSEVSVCTQRRSSYPRQSWCGWVEHSLIKAVPPLRVAFLWASAWIR